MSASINYAFLPRPMNPQLQFRQMRHLRFCRLSPTAKLSRIMPILETVNTVAGTGGLICELSKCLIMFKEKGFPGAWEHVQSYYLPEKRDLGLIDAPVDSRSDTATDLLQELREEFRSLKTHLVNEEAGTKIVSIMHSESASGDWEDLQQPLNEEIRENRTLRFLLGLDDSYSAIRKQILLMKPLPTVDRAYALILQEERRRSISCNRKTDETTAMAINRPRQGDSGKGNFNPGGKPNRGGRNVKQNRRNCLRPRCTCCNGSGHLAEKC